MGVDTVKLSYPLDFTIQGYTWVQSCLVGGQWRAGKYGTVGPVWWCERLHLDGTRVVVKGIGSDAHLLWEASVPKFLGIEGACDASLVPLVDRHLREVTAIFDLPQPAIRRFDVTYDVDDPDRAVLEAAKGWNPHKRSRYKESQHGPIGGLTETVWQHNKTRGVRVYRKFDECGEDWAVDLTRVEYQVRGDWLAKMGLDRLSRSLGENADRAILPLVAELEYRSTRQGAS